MLALTRKEILRVATLNMNYRDDQLEERVELLTQELVETKTDVLLLQELPLHEKDNILQRFHDEGFFYSHVATPEQQKTEKKTLHSTAILSRIPLEQASDLHLTLFPGALKASTSIVTKNGYKLLLISADLFWGAENGSIRLKQAQLLESFVARKIDSNNADLSIIGGTFNDSPDGDSVRYLKGLKTTNNTHSTFWVEATENTSLAHTPTTRHMTHLGMLEAVGTGILAPEHLPQRKVDYLFSKGWVYGKAGMPLNTNLFGVKELSSLHTLSDHYGYITDIWLPTK